MVALPPRPFTSMGLWVDRAESFRTLGLKRSVKSVLGYARVRFHRGREGKKGERCEVKWGKHHWERSVHICSWHLTTKASHQRREDNRSTKPQQKDGCAKGCHFWVGLWCIKRKKKGKIAVTVLKFHKKSWSICVIFTHIKILLLHACIHPSVHKHARVYLHAQSREFPLVFSSICVFRRVLQRSRKYSEVKRYQVLYYLEGFSTFCLCY